MASNGERPVPGLPTGTVTLLSTDIEGSTRVLQRLGNHYANVLAEYRRILRAAVQVGGGREIDTQGDALLAAFQGAKAAVAAAVAAQQKIMTYSWPTESPVRVRMGLHTGEPVPTGEGYIGLDVHRVVRICSAGHGGQILLSQTTYDLIAQDLPEGTSTRDLGIHRLKDLHRLEHLFQVLHPELPGEFPPLKALADRPNNLPVQLTSFVGRERETMEVRRLLATTRLLTLSGAGGCGKTRLAIQTAAELLEDYVDGIWLVELAAISDPELVSQAIASTLAVREEPGRPLLATLTEHLLPKQVLLLLDNCEHLVVSCAQLTDSLLRACPKLRVLVTSREPLGITGELIYRVPSLSLPALQDLSAPDVLIKYGATQLFMERARSTQPKFAGTDRTMTAIAQVCSRLDGIPLAIELAAARVKVLSVEQLLARLDDRFQFLTGGSRMALPRHQTLRATMDFSYDLLAEPERILFRRLSAFVGGFDLEAAEAACAGENLDSSEVLDLMARLVDKSLVLMEERGIEARYRLLETIREYAWDKLQKSGDLATIRSRHRDWYLSLAERAEPDLLVDPAKWLDQLEVEHANLRTALGWSIESGDAEAGLRLASALWRFWFVRGYFQEGSGWLEEILKRSRGVSDALRAKALNAAGHLATNQGAYGSARSLLEEGLAIQRRLGNARGMADVLSNLGLLATRQGDYAGGRAFLEESLTKFQALGDKEGIARSWNRLGMLALDQGDDVSSATCCQESLALYRELGAKNSIAVVLNNMGTIARRRGDYATARSLFEESLAIHRQLGGKRGVAFALNNLGDLAMRQGDYTTARSLFKESLVIRQRLGERRGIAVALNNFGLLAARQSEYIRAAQLLAAAEALRDAIGATLSPSDRTDDEYDRYVALVRAALGEQAEATWAHGRAMVLEQAIEYGLRESD